LCIPSFPPKAALLLLRGGLADTVRVMVSLEIGEPIAADKAIDRGPDKGMSRTKMRS